MAQTTLFLDTFTGPAGPLSGHTPEVGGYGYADGNIDGSGGAVPGGSGWVEVVGYPPPAAPAPTTGKTYTALSRMMWDGGGEPNAGINGSNNDEIFVELSADSTSARIGYISGDATEHTEASYSVTPNLSGPTTIIIVVGPDGSEITVNGDLVASIAEFTATDLDISPVSVSAYTEFGVLDELSLIESSPDGGGVSVVVEGAMGTGYGTPAAATGTIAAPLGVCTTQYGPIIAAYDVTVHVDAVAPSARSGTPLAWKRTTETLGTVHDAYGACTSVAGTPAAGHPQIAGVQGVSLTSYGLPFASTLVTPLSSCTTMAGQPSAAAAVSVHGVCGTKYGKLSNIIAHIVSGVCLTKYGKPKVAFPNGYRVYGLNNGRRAGVPRAAEIA